jgi:hypothetical protein
MLDLITTFLAWDLALAAALAVVLGTIVVLQGAYRAAAEALRRSPLPSRADAAAAVAAVRVPGPRPVDMVGSRR